MLEIIKISMLGISGVILGFIMKQTKPEYTVFITMAVGLLILFLAVGKISYLFEMVGEIRNRMPVDGEYLTTLVKMIGITYIGQFSADICKDAGYQATGSQIELFCRLSILVLSMPILLALLRTIEEFLI